MTKNRKLLSMLFLIIMLTFFQISFVQAAAKGTDSAQTEAKVEAILGVKSSSDYKWELSSDGAYWYALDIIYVAYPVNTAYQSMSIYVPAAYMKQDASGKVVFTNTIINGYNVNTAPILYLCEAPGYGALKAGSATADAQAEEGMKSGFVSVVPGHRGPKTTHTNSAGEKIFDGKSPWCLVDLKACIRYMKFNDKVLPGSSELIISSAGSGGGAMSTFLGCNANEPVYDSYLKEIGAVMSVGDDVFAAMCYCPITNVGNADMAYEWFFGTKSHLETLRCTDFQKLLSGYLAKGFEEYVKTFGYAEGEYEKVFVAQLEESANYYLNELKNGEATLDWTDKAKFKDAAHPTIEEIVKNYIAGYYKKTVSGMGGGPGGGGPGGDMAGGGPGGDMAGGGPGGDMAGGGPGGDMAGGGPGGDTAGGDMPGGMPVGSMAGGASGGGMPGGGSTTTIVDGEDISSWMAWDKKTQKVSITNLKNYKDYSTREKGITSFDYLGGNRGENEVFGDKKTDTKHYSKSTFDVITKNRDSLKAAWTDADSNMTGYKSFDDFYASFKSGVEDAQRDEYGNNIVDLYNPMPFIDSDKSYLNGELARHIRIRYGTADANTSLPIVSLLGDFLKKKGGVDVDFAFVWEGGHAKVEHATQSLYKWVDEICASVKKR